MSSKLYREEELRIQIEKLAEDYPGFELVEKIKQNVFETRETTKTIIINHLIGKKNFETTTPKYEIRDEDILAFLRSDVMMDL